MIGLKSCKFNFMLSKNKIKFFRSLSNKKYRVKHKKFIVEGKKMVADLVNNSFEGNIRYDISEIYATNRWLEENKHALKGTVPVFEVGNDDLKQVSSLATPNNVFAVVNIPRQEFDTGSLEKDIVICLDHIQDPGNMGTILRIADWFGIRNVLCSEDTVDVYNPKVVQASMGSILRTDIYYVELTKLLKEYAVSKDIPVYGTLLNGENINTSALSQNGFIVFGNESTGISDDILPAINRKITISPYPEMRKPIDSLNVSVAAGIICAAFRRAAIRNA